MKKRTVRGAGLFFSFLALVSLSGTELAAQPVVSDFEGPTDDGWTITGNFGSTVPDTNAAGGNPMAFISDLDLGAGLWWFVAPAKFLGAKSSYIGETLSWDLNQDLAMNVPGEPPHISAVIIEGGGVSLFHQMATLPGIGAWLGRSVVLDQTGTWTVGSDAGAAATAGDFTTVFANITSLRLRGDFNTGLETTGLDNVVMTPVELQSFAIE